MYENDNRIIITLDAGGTNFVFGAMRGGEFIVDSITLPSNAHDLTLCLNTLTAGFEKTMALLPERPEAISFAFPGPADYKRGIIGGYLPNFPSFRDGVALGPYLESKFKMPVFINNDGDLYAYGEATGGVLPELNKRIKSLGGIREYQNLLGFTFGTGLGIGAVINGQLNLGNNSCVEVFCLRNKHNPDIIVEDGASIRAIVREYGNLSGTHEKDLTPFDIFQIAEGVRDGDSEAAKGAFEKFGETAGDAFASAVSLHDALVVVGGGLTGAMKYIKPALLKEMRSCIKTLSGDSVGRIQATVFDLDDDAEFEEFVKGSGKMIAIPGSDRMVEYDPIKRTGLMVSKLGASKAISLGACNYALSQLDG